MHSLKRPIAKFLVANGFADITFALAGNGHYRVTATRAALTRTISFSATPSDSTFALKKVIADIRRAWAMPARTHRGDNRNAHGGSGRGGAARPVMPHVVPGPVRRDWHDALAALLPAADMEAA